MNRILLEKSDLSDIQTAETTGPKALDEDQKDGRTTSTGSNEPPPALALHPRPT